MRPTRHWFVALCFAWLSGCTNNQPFSMASQPLTAGGRTVVLTSGSPSPRSPSCPGNKLPDLCGSWAGVELDAVRTHAPPHNQDSEHCLCQPIAFQVPATLQVVQGNAGHHQAQLSYRTSGGEVVCHYRGNFFDHDDQDDGDGDHGDDHDHGHGHAFGHGNSNGRECGNPSHGHGGDHSPPSGPSGPLPGTEYVLEFCTNHAKAGDTQTADWFSLSIDGGEPRAGTTEVRVRLGAPDVVGGVVQEQVFYSSDPRIPTAALHVPRGSAPDFEQFSLTPIDQVPPDSVLPNGGDAATSVGWAVDVHAAGTTSFNFTPVAGAACPRIELPYDPALLASLASGAPVPTDVLHARQLLSVAQAFTAGTSLVPVGDVTVDPVRHTAMFCVTHLSFYLTTFSGWNSSLKHVKLTDGVGNVLLDADEPLTALPQLQAVSPYTLTLDFLNDGTQTWTSGTAPILTPVGMPSGTTVTGLTNTWGTGSILSFTNIANGSGTVAGGASARFVAQIVSPSAPEILNLCLQEGINFFGDCFSWEPGTGNGTGQATFTEICDGVDNNGDGQIDEGLTRACYDGPPGTEGVGLCHGGTSTCVMGAWGPCQNEVTPAAEICDNFDNNCNNSVDEDLSSTCYDGPVGTNNVGQCHSGVTGCINGTVVSGCVGELTPASEVQCDGVDNDCNGTVDDLPPASDDDHITVPCSDSTPPSVSFFVLTFFNIPGVGQFPSGFYDVSSSSVTITANSNDVYQFIAGGNDSDGGLFAVNLSGGFDTSCDATPTQREGDLFAFAPNPPGSRAVGSQTVKGASLSSTFSVGDEIICTPTPPGHLAGSVNVVVENSHGLTATSGTFTFATP